MGVQTDTELRPTPADSKLERCLKLLARTDWKAMAIVLAALAGLGGAIWNRVDAVIEKAIQGRTQQGVYELLATRMDELSTRLEKIELAHGLEAPVPPKGPDTPTPAPAEHGALPSPLPNAVAVVTVEPESKVSKLPSFDQIQQSAEQNRMPELLETSASPR